MRLSCQNESCRQVRSTPQADVLSSVKGAVTGDGWRDPDLAMKLTCWCTDQLLPELPPELHSRGRRLMVITSLRMVGDGASGDVSSSRVEMIRVSGFWRGNLAAHLLGETPVHVRSHGEDRTRRTARLVCRHQRIWLGKGL